MITNYEKGISCLVNSFYLKLKVLIGKPVYKLSPNGKIIVQIPYFTAKKPITEIQIEALGTAITRLLSSYSENSSVSGVTLVEVRLIRLRYPYLDGNILGQYVATNAGKYNFTRMHKMVFRKIPTIKMSAILPNDALASFSNSSGITENGHTSAAGISQLTGVKLELAGRLTTQRSIPRKTVSNKHTGSFMVSNNTTSTLDFSQYASKNKLGAYTIKV